jgi:hypothetical protein
MEQFTNREIAVGFWAAIFAVWALSRDEIRNAAWRTIQSIFRPKLLSIWIVGAGWIGLGIYLLHFFGFWRVEHLKGTAFWSLSAGIVVLVHGFSHGAGAPNYRKIVRDLFEVTVVLEVMLSTYCFSLPAELILTEQA